MLAIVLGLIVPACSSDVEHLNLVTENNAWGWIDVLDIHYNPTNVLDRMQKTAISTGYPNIGI